jgi:Zn-dependent peptidase ImmA (M78 family)
MKKDQILKLALECGQDTGSVDIVQLASRAGIDVYGTDAPDDFNAEITHIPSQNKFEILVNTNHSLNRQRFSVAHELAHFVLHSKEIIKYGSLKRSADQSDSTYFPEMEKEADEFGGELLIPEKLLKDHFPDIFNKRKNPLPFPKIQEISQKFKVSVLVAAIRLRQLGLNVSYISFSYTS